MTRTVFIYALCEPGTRIVRYIGKTVNLQRRFAEHLRRSAKKKTHFGNWLRSLDGDVPNLLVLREVPEAEGSAEEIYYIRVARMLNVRLTNATDGGEGLTGYNPSLRTRAKVSAANIGEKNPHFGKKDSAETRAKKSVAMTGERHPMFGKHHSPESRANMSAGHGVGEKNSNFGKKRSAEFCAKMRGKKRSSETRAKMSVAAVASWTSERRAAQSLITKAQRARERRLE